MQNQAMHQQKKRAPKTYLLVDPEDPALDVGVVIVGDVIHREDRAVLDGSPTIRPKRGVGLIET